MKKQKNRKKPFIIAGVIALVLGLIATILIISYPRFHIEKIPVKSGDTLSSILLPQNLSDQDILEIAKLLKKEKVPNLKADCDTVKIIRPKENEPIAKITIESGPWKKLEFYKMDSGWECNPIDIKKDTKLKLSQGEIFDGDSFYTSGIRAGIPESILASAYDLLAFEMDFERDMRPNQKFSILYEENYSDKKFVEPGNIIALSFDAGGSRGLIKMYRFMKQDLKIGYYDENGNGAIKSLKRTPINNARVTSSFSYNRLHPVLGYSRAHRGVDFRARTGTPIPSAGSGRIVTIGIDNGYGKFVRIRHNATYETLYAHMSRFAGLRVGDNVRQGQIIGYVGQTGIATGPHLHYEIIKNGAKVNPMTIKLPAIDNLSDDDRNAFIESRKKLDQYIKDTRK